MHRPLRLAVIWRDPVFAALPDRSRLVFLGLLELTNDRGVVQATEVEIARWLYHEATHRNGASREPVGTIVRRALQLLVANRFLRASAQADGRVRYRVSRWQHLLGDSLRQGARSKRTPRERPSPKRAGASA